MFDHGMMHEPARKIPASVIEKRAGEAESVRLRDDAQTEMTHKSAAKLSSSGAERRMEEADRV